MRSLHVAALAFPTNQGTQAALHHMLCALAAEGHDTHLLCYPLHHGGDPDASARPYRIHRVPGPLRQRSTRSGPSLEKILLDLGLAARAVQLCRALSPDLVVVHHVEAGLCGLVIPQRVLFMAHTSLRTELPSYFSGAWSAVTAGLGGGLDRFLCARHAGTLAVSPLLASLLSAEGVHAVASVGIPWFPVDPITEAERRSARAHFGLTSEQRVILYAGNLDAYQGLDGPVAAMAALAARRPELVWLVATGSPVHEFSRKLAVRGLGSRALFTSLGDESERRRVHAAADLVLVPRGAPGGVPVKLLDALARGVPVVTTNTACAGLPLPRGVVALVEDAGGWEAAIERVFAGDVPDLLRGREVIETAHAGRRFVSDLIAHATREGLLCVRE